MLRPKGKFVSEGRRIDVGPKRRMLGDILHMFPVVIDHVMQVFEASDIIFFDNNPFHLFLLQKA